MRTLSNAVDTVLLSRVQLTYSMPVNSGPQIGDLVGHMHDLIDTVSYPVGTFSSVNSYHGISPASFEVRTGIGVVKQLAKRLQISIRGDLLQLDETPGRLECNTDRINANFQPVLRHSARLDVV